MKFAHIADVHIGGWRDPKLKNANLDAFKIAIDKCVMENVEFILISGDLFNTALPPLDQLKEVTLLFKRLKDMDVPVYIIAGSHDFSASGKTMLDILENAGLFVNVARGSVVDDKLCLNFTEDRSGAKITGIIGKKGMLDKSYYEALDRESLDVGGFKIFMFHTAITEMKSKELEKMESQPVSLLPEGFDYYAGGHVHVIDHQNFDGRKMVVFPGPIFPNSFSELEKLGCGGFYIYNDGQLMYNEITLYPYVKLVVESKGSPEQFYDAFLKVVEGVDFNGALVTLRIRGDVDGKVSDVDFKRMFSYLEEKGAYFVMRNTSGLRPANFEEIKIDVKDVTNFEEKLVDEHLGQVKIWDKDIEKEKVMKLINSLKNDKFEGEKVSEFEKRVIDEFKEILEF